MNTGPDLQALYAQATDALKSRDYDRASDLFRQILLADENYRDVSRLLAESVRRGRQKWYRAPALLVAIAILALTGAALVFTTQLRARLAPNPTAPSLPVPWEWRRTYVGQEWARDLTTVIAVDHSDPDAIYVGTRDAGIYKTIDGGRSWQPSHQGLVHGSVVTLLSSPVDSGTLYAGVELAGVFKTDDAGQTWRPVNNGIHLPGSENVSHLAMDPGDSGHLFFTNGERIFETRDAGDTWSRLEAPDCPASIADLVLDPSDPNTLYVTEQGYDPTCPLGIYKAELNGPFWSFISADFTDMLWIGTLAVRSEPLELFFLTGDGGLHIRSEETGLWSRPADLACLAMLDAVDRNGALYCGTYNGLFASADAGKSWRELLKLEGSAARIQAIAMAPAPSTTLIAAGLPGLFVSADEGASWTDRSAGMGAGKLNLTEAAQASGTLYLEDDGHGLYRSSDSAQTWQALPTDGQGFSQGTDAGRLYRWRKQAEILVSIDGGSTWSSIEAPSGGEEGLHAMRADPEIPGRLYALYDNRDPTLPVVYVSSDSGQTWAASNLIGHVCDPMLFFPPLDSEASDAGNRTVYLVGCDQGSELNLQRSEDGGQTWAACTNADWNWVARSVTRMTMGPGPQGDRLVVATRGQGIRISDNDCRDWHEANNGLLSLFVNTVAIDANTPGTMFAGTDGGAYISFDGGELWNEINDGLLGATVVYSIVVDAESNVYAATPYGVFTLEGK